MQAALAQVLKLSNPSSVPSQESPGAGAPESGQSTAKRTRFKEKSPELTLNKREIDMITPVRAADNRKESEVDAGPISSRVSKEILAGEDPQLPDKPLAGQEPRPGMSSQPHSFCDIAAGFRLGVFHETPMTHD